MKNIITIKPLNDFKLEVLFENDCIKTVDFKKYLELPVFKVLKDFNNFCEVKNKKYFIEWEKHEIDMSADTLWHVGV